MYNRYTQREIELRKELGTYKFTKMKKLNLNSKEELEMYEKQKREESKLREQLGTSAYYKMKKLGFENYEDYKNYMEQEKSKRAEKRHIKNKIRYRTIRYIERKCNIERKCQICGQNAQIHHPDYNKYLVVNLLCRKHHMELHKGLIKQPPTIDLMNYALIKKIS